MRSEGCELLLSDGPAIDAVVAAASIPGVFPPVEMAERRLIDGGVVNNTPISHAAEIGAVRIYVLPTQDPCRPLGRVPKGALDAAIYGLELLIDSRLKTDIAQYSRETEIIVLPAQTPPVCNRRASSTLPVSSAKRSSPRGPFLNPRASAGTSGSQHRGTRRRMVGE